MTASQSYIGQISHNNENEKMKLNHFPPFFLSHLYEEEKKRINEAKKDAIKNHTTWF